MEELSILASCKYSQGEQGSKYLIMHNNNNNNNKNNNNNNTTLYT